LSPTTQALSGESIPSVTSHGSNFGADEQAARTRSAEAIMTRIADSLMNGQSPDIRMRGSLFPSVKL
jgi:hypothetical protein